jgi:N-acetyl-beta-hexosaminidase
MSPRLVKSLLITISLSGASPIALAETHLDGVMPVRGFCIAAPGSNSLSEFVAFVKDELVPRQVNTLVLRVDYRYQYENHPELRASAALSREAVKTLVAVCKTNNVRIVPHINLLGHQSWAGTLGNLLRQYPEFDETPQVKMPDKYKWPNPDGLYCKSYCPLHPKVHDVVFSLIDELCDAFEADSFHAGMDEVFYIGDDKCPRCSGHDKAELFAGEVRRIHDHLSKKGRRLWIWGDRLLDGTTTGLGEWEASVNGTSRAIDLIPKDVVICDWHYERPDQTAVYFAVKGFQVVTCTYRKPSVGIAQATDMVKFRKSSTPEMKGRFQGVMQTVWSDAGRFLSQEYHGDPKAKTPQDNSWQTFVAMFDVISRSDGRE